MSNLLHNSGSTQRIRATFGLLRNRFISANRKNQLLFGHRFNRHSASFSDSEGRVFLPASLLHRTARNQRHRPRKDLYLMWNYL